MPLTVRRRFAKSFVAVADRLLNVRWGPLPSGVYRDNVISHTRRGWVVAGWAWPFLRGFLRWDRRDGQTFVVHTLQGQDLGRPVGPYQFRELHLAPTPTGAPALLWIDYEPNGRPLGDVTGALRSAVYTDNGWGPVTTLATGVRPLMQQQVRTVQQPGDVGIATRAVTIGRHRNGRVEGAVLRLHCVDDGWRVFDEVDWLPHIHFGRWVATWPAADPTATPALVVGGIDPTTSAAVLQVYGEAGAPPVVITDVPTEPFALAAAVSADGVRWIVSLMLVGSAMSFTAWREERTGEWTRTGRWSPPPDFQVNDWQVLTVTATTVQLGMDISRFSPESPTTLMLTWDENTWQERRLPNEGPGAVVGDSRWLQAPDGRWRCWRHKGTRKDGYNAVPPFPV